MTQTNDSSSAAHRSFIRKWASLFVLSLALAIVVIDTTLLNVSLKTIINDLHTDLHSIQWVISAYTLVLSALTITGGRLGDIYGRKEGFMFGAILFAVGSFVASISWNFWSLLGGESIIEGIGAALMIPATTSLIVSNFEGRDRAIAFGVWGAVAGVSAAIGPLFGGFLTTHFSWRWGFRINVGVVVLLLLGSFLVKDSRDTTGKIKLDIPGVIVSAIGMIIFVFGLVEASDYGWWKATQPLTIAGWTVPLGYLSPVPFLLAAGLLIMWIFLLMEDRREKRDRDPLVSITIFKNRQFFSGATATAMSALGMSGLFFAIPVFLQAVRDLDAFDTGVALLPLSVGLLIASPGSGFLSHKISPKRLIQWGLIVNVVSLVILWYVLSVNATMWTLLPGLFLYGFGMGMMVSQASNLTLSAVHVSQTGEASGINATMRQLGSTLGTALIGSIFLSTVGNALTNGIRSNAGIPADMKQMLAQKLGGNVSALEFGNPAQMFQSAPQQIVQAVVSVSHQAIVDGARISLICTALMIVIALLLTLLIPNVKQSEMHAKEE
ncbi:MAG TPA: MFS transporter [Candidatus Peribacteraceae bacterium]|nr:MFS transporter [Candidatus Peribacteraceae bacterium]